MKAAIISTLSVIFVVILVIGNINWNLQSDSPIAKIKDSSESSASSEESNGYFSQDYYMSFASSWPESAQKVLEKNLSDKKPFHIVLLGSASIGNQDLGLITSLKEALAEKYDQYVTIDSIVFDGTSTDYVEYQEYEALVDKKPDMVIFEPFLLNDNNVIDISSTLTNVSKVISETQDVLPDVTFILQPAQQIYDASLYPMQVSDLQKYAQAEKIPYWNHWEAWPDGKDKAVLDYLDTKDGSAVPNEQGYALWSKYLADQLIAN